MGTTNKYAERKAEKAAAGRIGFWGWFAWLFILSMGLAHEKTWGSLLILADLFFLGVIIYRRVQFSKYVGKLAAEKKREMQAPPPAPLTPAAWYHDPSSQHPEAMRWWDGTQWTDST